MRFASVFCVLASIGFGSVCRGSIQIIADYRLGEDDPGAGPGNIGQNATFDRGPNHLNLTREGMPHYSFDVGASGSMVSMRFNPATLDSVAATLEPAGAQRYGILPLVGRQRSGDLEAVCVYRFDLSHIVFLGVLGAVTPRSAAGSCGWVTLRWRRWGSSMWSTPSVPAPQRVAGTLHGLTVSGSPVE